jgi:hypothetical protein
MRQARLHVALGVPKLLGMVVRLVGESATEDVDLNDPHAVPPWLWTKA